MLAYKRKRKGKCMDSRDKRDSDDSVYVPDTSHLDTKVVTGKKKSSKKPLAWLVVLVLVVAAGAGAYFYKTNVLDKDANETVVTPTPTPSPTPKKLTAEEQMTAQLTGGVKKEIEELKKHDDNATTAIKNSTQAAISVGGNLHEDELKD